MKMSALKESYQDDDEISPPLFVKIQTIDLQSLDFQTNIGSTAKFRHLTYVEATNLFLFVGSTSGSVYVFSRDTFKFLFIIPFKGGKVCNIACSQDEYDIAVGSIRGKVSIYRISPNVHYMLSSASAPLIDAFRDIYDVPHHVCEITELQWSHNGKYLFVGDSQGIVSQMDVACLEEFPRPVPSKVILKLQSRVLQIVCSFPYLAVCTLAAVFLCDLEKEDFTRVQCTKNVDMLSTGLSLMILPERSSVRDLGRENVIPSAKLVLFIGEPRLGVIHCCNMEGNVQASRKVQVSKQVSQYPMPLFDPTKQTIIPETKSTTEEETELEEDEESMSISLGKMLCTDDGMIVSISNDRLYVYDPYTLNVIAWNEDFKRINNFKIISNYAFIWTGNKLEVVALTPFRSYAEQLFRANLINVLESWIGHTMCALGWNHSFVPNSRNRYQGNSSNGECENESHHQLPSQPESTSADCQAMSESPFPTKASKCAANVIYNFRKMMFSESEEENEFTKFVDTHLPFPLVIREVTDIPSSSSPSGSTDSSSAAQLDETSEVTKNHLEKPIHLFLNEVESAMQLFTMRSSHITPSLSSSSSSISDNHLLRVSSSSPLVGNNDNSKILSIISQMLKNCRHGQTDVCTQFFGKVWKALLVFYEDVGCSLPQLDYRKSDITLSHVLQSAQSFLSQSKLFTLSSEIRKICDISKFEDVIIQLISCLYCQQSQFMKNGGDTMLKNNDTLIPTTSSSVFNLCFTKFAQCPLVMQWFRECGTSQATLFYDGLLADTLLLLLPLMPVDPESEEFSAGLISLSLESIGIYEKLPKYFMTWLTLCKFLHKSKQVPYSPLLRSLLNEQLFEKLAEEMFSTIYRDFRLSSFGNSVHYLHHFVSVLVLLSKSPSCGHPRTVSILLICFPLTKWAREDIVTKVIAACHLNPCLLGLYLKACLEDGHSLKLCACGIQAGYGSLEGKISSWQRAIEESVIKLLLEEYFKSSPYDDEEAGEEIAGNILMDGNGNSTQKRRVEMLVHIFAMRRGLLETYFRSPLPDEFLTEEMQAELIVRSGSCASLKYFQCDERKMSLLIKCYENNFSRFGDNESLQNNNKPLVRNKSESIRKTVQNYANERETRFHKRCRNCSKPLHQLNPNFKPFSRDCLGLWAMKQLGGNLARLIEMIQNCNLNHPNIFSARFYGAVGKLNDETYKGSKYDFDFAGEATTTLCNGFHQ